MKHELLLIRSLLVASMLVCGLILGNMLGYSGDPIQLASKGAAATVTGCALPQDGVMCVRSGS